MLITIPCDCPAEEHELDITFELGYTGQVGYYGPNVGDVLPCGRVMQERDALNIVDRLKESFVREDEIDVPDDWYDDDR